MNVSAGYRNKDAVYNIIGLTINETATFATTLVFVVIGVIFMVFVFG